MAKPQLENGHTQIANEILEHLMRMYLPPNQWQVLLCIIRKTYGFHKKVDWIANSQIIEATGLVKSTVSRALKALEQQKLITRNKKSIGFQKDWEKWQRVSSIANKLKLAELSTLDTKLAGQLTNKKLAIPQPKLADRKPKLAELSTKVSSLTPTQKIKDTLTKDTLQKKGAFTPPEWIDKDTWDAFLEMRKKIRAVPTEYAKVLLIKKLGEFREAGDDPNEILKRSIMNGWKGVFPLDEKGGQGGRARTSKGHNRTIPTTYTPPEKWRISEGD